VKHSFPPLVSPKPPPPVCDCWMCECSRTVPVGHVLCERCVLTHDWDDKEQT
jgi:hypothetical protein